MEVCWAYCTCPAGIGGGCQHVVALLFTLERAQKEGGRIAAPESCTSLKRSRGLRERNVAPTSMQNVMVERANFTSPDKNIEGAKQKRKKWKR